MEQYPKPITKQVTQKILEQMDNSFYLINQNNNNFDIAFFCHIKCNKENIPVLVINNYLKNEDIKDSIDITVNNKKENIKLTDIIYKNKTYNTTIIVIKKNNNNIRYIDMDDKLYENKYDINYYKESIYIIQCFNKEEFSVSYGIINNNNENEFFYSGNIRSKYSFIFNSSNNKLIGKHEKNSRYFNEGVFFNTIIKEFIYEYKNKDKMNEIIISINIREEDIKKGEIISFLGNYEFKDKRGNMHYNYNLKDLIITEVKINDETCKNKTSFLPNKTGENIIKIQYKHNIIDYSYFFAGCNKIKNVNFVSLLNKGITNMKYMFYGCEKLKEINILGFDTQKVTDMSYMFYDCNSLNNLDLSSFDTKNVTNMSEMFYNCNSLIEIINISDWNTENVSNMSGMFYYCKSLKKLPDISKWNTKNVINMSNMFYRLELLEELPDISKWNIKNVIDMNGIFGDCYKLKKIPDISKWDTKNVTNMSQMFYDCYKLKELPDISEWETKKVTNMSQMFYSCKALKELPDISKWDTKNVTNMSQMFGYCNSLDILPDISKWDTKNVINMNQMFYHCNSLKELPDISKWDIQNVKDKSGIFDLCYPSTKIPKKFKE